MPGKRLLCSLIIRVTVTDGTRLIQVLDMAGGDSWVFRTYGELIQYLQTLEEYGAQAGYSER